MTMRVREYAYCTHMSIDCCDAFVGSRLQEFTGNDLLNCEYHTIFTSNTDRSSPIFYCLHGIFNLEISAVGREDRVAKIVTCTYGRLNGE